MSQTRQRFNKLHEKAKQLRKSGKLPEAQKTYGLILKTIDIKEVDYVDFIVVMSQMGDIEREMGLISESKNKYIHGLNLLQKAPSSVTQYEIQKEKYHLYSNLGLAECSETQKISDKMADYQKFRTLINQTLRYYKICESIVVKMIMEDKDKLQQNQDQNKFDWWKTQFVAVIVNLCTALSEEAFQFQDKYLMGLMITLIQKAQNFYELCRNRTRKNLENYLSKSFYFKAICLKFLNKNKESEKYFIKDYNYCKQKNLFDDLNKTKQQIFKFYLQNFKFNEAKQYYKNSTAHVTFVNEKEKQLKDLMRLAQQMKSKVRKSQKIEADSLQGILYDLHEMKCPQKGLQFSNFMRQAKEFKYDLDFRYWVEYYAAQYHTKLGFYQEALKHLKEAIRIKEKQPTEKAWCSLLNAMILENLQTDKNTVRQAYLKCVELSNNQQDKDCQIQCLKQIKRFEFNEQRTKVKITYDTSLSDRLLKFMNEQKIKRIEAKKNRMDLQQVVIQDIPQQMQEQIYRPQRQLIRPLNQIQGYIQECKILNQQTLEVFKQLLKNPSNIDLEKLIYFNPQQLLALLNSTSKISNLDLTNFIMTIEYLKRIRSTQNSHNFKSIKINMVNASVIKDQEKIQFYAQIYRFLKENLLLQYLSISNAYESQKLTKIIHAKDINCLQTLTVLKLKQCQLQDKDLIFFSLGENLPQLKKLSLSNNKLKGRTLQLLTSLKFLQKLSLSSNPLDQLNLNKKFQSLKKISLNNLTDSIPQKVHQIFIYLLNQCETVKMKNCQKVCQDILIKLIENAMSLQTSLFSLRKLNLFGSKLRGNSIVQTLQRYMNRSPNLSQIDLRNCKIISYQNNEIFKSEFQQFQRAFNDNQNQFYHGFQSQQHIKALKISNLRFINEMNSRILKNFSVI